MTSEVKRNKDLEDFRALFVKSFERLLSETTDESADSVFGDIQMNIDKNVTAINDMFAVLRYQPLTVCEIVNNRLDITKLVPEFVTLTLIHAVSML